MPKKHNKLVNISLIYTDRYQLEKAFQKILYHIKRGEEQKSDSWSWSDEFIYYEFTQSYSVNYSYKEAHINGNVCHVYKSKI
tara:strand:- start:1366 stop:1611 length:246 start_codon:yes stop_codon:yes gene_type:complete